MLIKVYIKNFALFEELHITFSPGFNVITGETGAGKSLIINALNSILGEKVSTDVLRKGSEKAVVEGFFDSYPQKFNSILTQNEIDVFEEELICRRELNRSGRSRTFINDCVTHIDLLKQISDQLVDLHGQHEHQALLREEDHYQYLDAFGSLDDSVNVIKEAYAALKDTQSRLDYLKRNAQQLKEKREFLQYQIQEIESLNLHPNEEDELLQEEKILKNYEKLVEGCNQVYQTLYDAEESVYSSLGNVQDQLEEIAQIDGKFSEYLEYLSEAAIQIEEVSRFVKEYVSCTDYDPNRLEEIRLRLSQLTRIKKKYGLPIEEILKKHETNKQEINQIENLDEDLQQLEKELDQNKDRLASVCEEQSILRKESAKGLEQQIESTLHQIGMENAHFRIQFDRFSESDEGTVTLKNGHVAKSTGQDKITFIVSTNPGEDYKPLVKIASGGELSRTMLAVKSVLAEKDEVGVLVFDEIDLGISGRIAESVGRKLKELSGSHQIICVTHLPQIAGFADKHFSVRKEVQNGETFAYIQELTYEQRIHEIAYLLGGEKITDVALKNAQEMLEMCHLQTG